jgi:hypothetical protein
MNESAHASWLVLEDQGQTIRETAQCAVERDAKLWFFQDFMILDLEEGRSSERQLMLERRRTEVTGANGTFVDLLEAFNSSAGVSWFNDLIHLSSVGHGHVARLMCQTITPGAGAARRYDG